MAATVTALVAGLVGNAAFHHLALQPWIATIMARPLTRTRLMAVSAIALEAGRVPIVGYHHHALLLLTAADMALPTMPTRQMVAIATANKTTLDLLVLCPLLVLPQSTAAAMEPQQTWTKPTDVSACAPRISLVTTVPLRLPALKVTATTMAPQMILTRRMAVIAIARMTSRVQIVAFHQFLALALLIATVMGKLTTWILQTAASARALVASPVRIAASLLHVWQQLTAVAMVPPQTPTRLPVEAILLLRSVLPATATVPMATLASIAQCLHLAILLWIAATMEQLLIWTRQMDASACALTGSPDQLVPFHLHALHP